MAHLYRKKPVTIEAMQWDGDEDAAYEVIDWIDQASTVARRFDAVYDCYGNTIAIKTLEGVITASAGDWIIRGVQGEFYPCKPDIFEQTYEAVTIGKR